ncbi:hypothetical protein ACFQY5_35375 [Paeniroseomonas aquatica]|uniref:hypothetical protein n=1 Tax=Paeniroseomonas aquatica TaxID=373043 RepID=UPI0036066E83
MTCHGGSIIALPLLAGLAGAATTFVVFVCSAAAPKATVSAAAPPGLPAKRFPKPPRPVAGIVSDQRSNEDSREGTGEAAKVMDLLGILPGMTVADIGAGTGNYIARLSHRVGPGGRVVAQDVKLSPSSGSGTESRANGWAMCRLPSSSLMIRVCQSARSTWPCLSTCTME